MQPAIPFRCSESHYLNNYYRVLAPYLSPRLETPKYLGRSLFCPKVEGCVRRKTRSARPQKTNRVLIAAMDAGVMDWGMFKKSIELGFVRRHRNFLPESGSEYALDKKTLRIDVVRGSPALTGSVISRDQSRTPLSIVVSAFSNGSFRLVLEDPEPLRHERHVVKGVLMDHVKPIALSDAKLTCHDQEAELVLPGWDTKLKIQYSPFRLDLVAVADDKKVVLSVNEHSRLKVDAFETKEQVGSPGEDEQGCWEETFKDFSDPKVRGPESVGVDVSFPSAEQLHGIPERTMDLALGNTVAADGTITSEPYRLYNLDVPYYELDKPLGLYGSVPLLIGRDGQSSAAVFWHNSSETYVDASGGVSTSGKKSHWYSEAGQLDMFLLPGPSVREVYRQYLWLTGNPAMPQYFSLGYHQCRYSYMSDEDARGVNAGFEKHDIPYDVLWLDIDHTDGKRYFTWNNKTFPDPKGLQDHTASFGRKTVTIIDPHVKRDPNYSLHQLAEGEGLYVTNPDDNGEAFSGKCWAGESSYLDYNNSKVRDAWASRFSETNYPGFTPHLHVWNDMNEPSVFNGPEGTIPKHMQHAGGVEHRHVHNLYGHDMVKATFAGLHKARNGTDRPFILTRSFFAGSQRYSSVWTGDNGSEWSHLAASVPMLLSLQLCGIVQSGADVGGFFRNPKGDSVARWYQAAAFQPFFRGHSGKGTKRREPWDFGEPFTKHIRDAIRARYELMPLWYTLFASIACGTGAGFGSEACAPPMRPVWWEFPNEPDDDGRWMVGDCLLVAPVMTEGAKEHTVELPAGAVWYDLYDPVHPGVKLPGVERVTKECGLDRMFVMQRGGTIVPKLEKKRSCSKYMSGDSFTLVVGLDEVGKAEGILYVDDGRSYEFEKGKFGLMKFDYEEGRLKVCRIGGEGEIGRETRVEKVVVLGFGEDIPQSVTVDGRKAEFLVDKEAGIVTVKGFDAGSDGAAWEMQILC